MVSAFFRGRLRGKRPIKASTLVELLVVIALMGVLLNLTFGAARGVKERAVIARARGELAILAQALEDYRRQYGDYPQAGASLPVPVTSSLMVPVESAEARLFNALAGKLGPTLTPLNGRSFVEPGRFTLASDGLPAPADFASVPNCFIDPWGHRYLYYYRDAAATGQWSAPGYVLYSAGPDGLHDAPAADGACDMTTACNSDNIYAGR